MPYIVASIIAAVSALIILLTRYDSDDSTIKVELENMKSMIFVVDGFVDTFIQSGGDISEINFQKLYDDGILPENIKRSDDSGLEDSDGVVSNLVSVSDPLNPTDSELKAKLKSTLKFPNNEVIWQLIPNIENNTSYKILVNMTTNSALDSRAGFAESFLGKEYCEKALFGEFETKGDGYDDSVDSETFTENGNEKDGKFVCIIYK